MRKPIDLRSGAIVNVFICGRAHLETLHPQLIHADLRRFDSKAAPRGGKDFRLAGGLKGRLAWKRIGKGNHFTPGHFGLP